ncbi:MAG: C-GCAxxG-C-C family protein [Dehalococcoidia bacterium]
MITLLDMKEKEQKQLAADFIKSFSCSYAMAKTMGRVLDVQEDELLLRSVIGFGSGVGTMGDTCGAVNGGVIALGRRFPNLPSPQFYSLCAEYFRRLNEKTGTLNCGEVHGGRELVPNLRRTILRGKTRQCTRILKEGSQILAEMVEEFEKGNFQPEANPPIERMSDYFDGNSFHCAQSTISRIGAESGLPVEHILAPSRGFCGGIGCNGTMCGAIAGGVLCLGLQEGVDLSQSGYRDTMRIMLYGILKGEGIFRDGKRFLPARLFARCRKLYRAVEEEFGGAHCRDILGLRLDSEEGSREYIAENKIELCRGVVDTVARRVKAR